MLSRGELAGVPRLIGHESVLLGRRRLRVESRSLQFVGIHRTVVASQAIIIWFLLRLVVYHNRLVHILPVSFRVHQRRRVFVAFASSLLVHSCPPF